MPAHLVRARWLHPVTTLWDLPCNQCILCWLEPMPLVWCILCHTCMRLLSGGWGELAASRPICEEFPMSMGVPPTERSGARHQGKGPRYGQKSPCSRAHAAESPLKGEGRILCSTSQCCSCDRRPRSHPVIKDSQPACNEWIQVQRLDGRRSTPSGVGSR